jgi:hypothetical protein
LRASLTVGPRVQSAVHRRVAESPAARAAGDDLQLCAAVQHLRVLAKLGE